jgi:tRNA(Ile2) C34 agmatinyltransferase TiaS
MRQRYCPVCDGPGMLLGSLGHLVHWRCQNCGMDFSSKARAKWKRKPA